MDFIYKLYIYTYTVYIYTEKERERESRVYEMNSSRISDWNVENTKYCTVKCKLDRYTFTELYNTVLYSTCIFNPTENTLYHILVFIWAVI